MAYSIFKVCSPVSVPASGTDAQVIPAVPGRRLLVCLASIGGGATSTQVTFNSKPAGAGSPISETFTIPANNTLTLPETDKFHFRTAVGEGLSVTTGVGGNVSVQVGYVEEY